MSGVYIPNMEMPQVCGECPFFVHDDDDDDMPTWCGRTNFDVWDGNVEYYDKPPKYCDLIPLPEHGDLIDRSKIGWFVDDSGLEDFDYAYRSQINSMPTIIPADTAKGE